MIEHLTLEQLRDFLDPARAFAIIPDDELGHWIRIRPERIEEAFRAGLAPFSALTRYIGHDPVYEVTEGTPFLPSLRPTLKPVVKPWVSWAPPARTRTQVMDLRRGQLTLARSLNQEKVGFFDKTKHRSYTNLEDPERYYMGYKLEFAFLNYLELYAFDFDFEVVEGHRSAPTEFTLPVFGVRSELDAKAQNRYAKEFKTPKDKSTSAPYYLGGRMCRDDRKVELMGWCSRKELLAMPISNRWRDNVPSRWCPWEKLHGMDELDLTVSYENRDRFIIVTADGRRLPQPLPRRCPP